MKFINKFELFEGAIPDDDKNQIEKEEKDLIKIELELKKEFPNLTIKRKDIEFISVIVKNEKGFIIYYKPIDNSRNMPFNIKSFLKQKVSSQFVSTIDGVKEYIKSKIKDIT